MPTAYDVITDRIVARLEDGVVPWRKPWKGGAGGVPRNLASGKSYRGINVFFAGHLAGFGSPYFVTFRQANKLGGSVRRGEHGLPVFFWKWYERERDGTTEEFYSTLFHELVHATGMRGGLRVTASSTT